MPATPEDTRLTIVIRLERLALVARYIALFALVVLFLLGWAEGRSRDAAIVTVVVFLQNAFVHGVLLSRRYWLFQTPMNFLVHLLSTTLVVYFTGRESSDLYVLYLLLLIGYTAYSRRYGMILLVSFLFCFSYVAMVVIEWSLHGLSVPLGIIAVKVLSIAICGWLVASTSELLRIAEKASLTRERALASSESTLRTILDSTADPIFVYGEDELIREANNKACEFLKLQRKQVIGRTFRSFLFDDGSLDEKMAAISSRGEYHGEEIFIASDGRERTVGFSVRSFHLAADRLFVVVAHDITEQKNLHEATLLANENLARLNRELQIVNELKTGLLATVAQEIRSPLTATLGYVDMLLDDELGELDPEQRKALLSCKRSALRIFHLVDDAVDIHARETDPAVPTSLSPLP